MEVDQVDMAGVRIRYRLCTAEFSIAVSAVYQLLLLDPQRGCFILSELREWERSHRLTDTWAANTPRWASLGDLGWEDCGDQEIFLSSCGLSPPPPAAPPQQSPPPPPPRRETQTPCPAPPPPPPPPPPPATHPTKKAPDAEPQVLGIGQQLVVGPGTRSWTWEGGGGEAAAAAKAARGTPLFGGG